MQCNLDKSHHKYRIFAPAAWLLIAVPGLYAQTVISAPTSTATLSSTKPALTSSEIVEQMLEHNRARAEGLKHYESIRHYEVEYKGYAAKIGAKLVVEADYDAATGKSFHIISQSGNGLLVDKVLKRLVESEKDADQERGATALTPANYKFKLAGIENVDGRPAYMLEVEPLVDSKYLYRGKIWVDAAEFAVARIEAAPAKNPSLWISSTAINHQYTRTDGFWLPAQNRSETKVRVGGTAVLTIDYGKYQVEDQGAGNREQGAGNRN
jgi:hypothetical protein